MMTLTRTRITRLTAATVLAVTAILVPLSVAGAAPTEQEVEQALAEAERLAHVYENAGEAHNDAIYRLEQVRDDLADAKQQMDEAASAADTARQALSDRAVETYTAMGSQLDVLLEAQDFSQFSDRLTFMGAIAESDADIAAAADAAGQRAEWAAKEYDRKLQEAQALERKAAALFTEAKAAYAEQQAIAADLGDEYDRWVAAQNAAAEAAAGAADTSGGSGGGTNFSPPNVNGAAGTAINYAYGALGSTYVWGSAGPSAYDCSGLTSAAWAAAGVSIPHSASAQWSSLPRVNLSDVQPGDIIYYGNFGPHVALYVGGGQIIHARHPGPGGEVQLDGMYAYDEPWGAVRVA
jgi:cell wall-associated NlpC family hydrolase